MRHYLIIYTAADGAKVTTYVSSVLPMAEAFETWKLSHRDARSPCIHNPDHEPAPMALVNAGIIQEAAKRYPESYLDKVAFENGAICQRDGKLRAGASPRGGDAFEAGQAWQRALAHPFAEWSPARLAHALGYRFDLVSHGMGERRAFLIGPTGRRHYTGYDTALKTLRRLAERKGVDPHCPPLDAPRALQNGKEVAPC